MKKRKLIHTGKAKSLYEGPTPNIYIQYFKDDVTANNSEKHKIFEGKGIYNNFISAFLMDKLSDGGIETHFIERLNSREQHVRVLQMIPLEVVIRRRAFGSICKRYGIEEGDRFRTPLIEFFLKDDARGDPLITPEAILLLDYILDESDLDEIVQKTYKINDILYGVFAAVDIELVDFKLEFGYVYDSEFDIHLDVILGDEISPDNCRLKCMRSGKSLDKDLFRQGTGNLLEAYKEIASRFRLLDAIDAEENKKVVSIR